MASLIVTQRDMGCQATGVVHLDEGVNTDSLQAAEFWNLLGGQTQYKGKSRTVHPTGNIPSKTTHLFPKTVQMIFVCLWGRITLQVQTVQMMMSTMREPYQSQTVFIGCRGTDSAPMSRPGLPYHTSLY